jgi:serine/threonine-protein kinase HipA
MGKQYHLNVYLNTRLVGELIQSSAGAMSFQYAKEWIQEFPDYGISLSLPVQEAPYRGEEVFAYFDNLLPDNQLIRKAIAAKVMAKSDRTFDLLSSVGKDCVGALTFVKEKEQDNTLAKAEGDLLSERDIEKIITNLKSYPLGMQEAEFRLSLAGAQEKTALLKKGNQYYRPKGKTATTHILKPPMGQLQNGIDLRTSVENEWLCLKLCAFAGLEVAKADIAMFGDHKCLVVERFDRLWFDDKLVRLAQEDLCQALHYPSTQKYESDGGPTIKNIMKLLDASLEREKDRYAFMKSQLLFWLLGATDGHAKNYSLFIRTDGFMMTPFYDVMSMYPALNTHQVNLREMRLSFKLGKSRYDRIDKIRLRHFYETAHDCGFSYKQVDKMVEELKALTQNDFDNFIVLPTGFPQDIYDAIIGTFFNKKNKLLQTSD